MHTWFHAVCDQHKEFIEIYVDTPHRTVLYLGDKSDDTYTWLMLHYGCELRMIHRDDQLDQLFEGHYTDVKLNRNSGLKPNEHFESVRKFDPVKLTW